MQAQRHDQPACGNELPPPWRGEIPRPCGDDDPVERRAGGVGVGAVRADHVDLAVSGGGQAAAGLVDEIGVDVDGGDLTGRADQFLQERGVDAGRGADLQHAVAGVEVELFQHVGDDPRGGGRGERGGVGGAFGHDNLGGVGPVLIDAG